MSSASRHLFLLRTLLIVAVGFWIYAPALNGGWLMDDDFYLPQNALVHDPHRLWKTWFQPGSLIEYYPLEATVQAVQWHFWHLNMLGYHLTNVVLHILGALLFWRLLEKFNLKLAWLGGFLFLVHPVTVESVAWISELKNTLSLPPFLLAMICWINYDERRDRRDYLLAVGFFLIAMLCKISMALFPFIILLYAWWKRDRVGWHDLKSSVPFFAISLPLGITTILAGNWHRIAHLQSLKNPAIGGWQEHFVLSGTSVLFYFTKCVFPVGLIPIYPKWSVALNSPLAGAWLIVLAALIWFWAKRKTWGRHALLGFGFFLINLLPFIGLTSVSYMGFTWAMDHLVYLPLLGLIGLGVATFESFLSNFPIAQRPLLTVPVAILLALLAWESRTYADVFSSGEKMWSYTASRNPTSWYAHNNLANGLIETGRIPEAIAEYQEALRYNSHMVEAHTNLGLAFDLTGRNDEARQQYELALKYNPHFGLAHANLGRLLLREGHDLEAKAHLEEAHQINPEDEGISDSLKNLKKSE